MSHERHLFYTAYSRKKLLRCKTKHKKVSLSFSFPEYMGKFLNPKIDSSREGSSDQFLMIYVTILMKFETKLSTIDLENRHFKELKHE